MGLLKSVGRAVGRVVKVVPKPVRRIGAAALLGGHSFTAVAAKVKPGVVGLKSPQARAVVATTQRTLVAGGATAMGVGGLSAKTTPVAPPAVSPQNTLLEQLLGLLLFTSLWGGRRR